MLVASASGRGGAQCALHTAAAASSVVLSRSFFSSACSSSSTSASCSSSRPRPYFGVELDRQQWAQHQRKRHFSGFGTVSASSTAKSTTNPIRKTVERIQVKPNADKEMIPLHIGDPTVFGNFLPPPGVLSNAFKAKRTFLYTFHGKRLFDEALQP